MNYSKCRFCSTNLKNIFVDLGSSPIANEYINDPLQNETFFPLKVYTCSECLLVQLPNTASRERIFQNKYAYFSSYSSSWISHAKTYVDYVTDRFSLSNDHLVIEVASNDGYLLQFFKSRNIPHLGIEPAENVAQIAEKNGIKTISKFFGKTLAQELAQEQKPSLMIGNNVLAHVPDINDFVSGFKILLKEDGIATFEFPHIEKLIKNTEFDTIYHEHYSYFSFTTVEKIFAFHGLRIFDVQKLITHGGSLRIFVCHTKAKFNTTEQVQQIKEEEASLSLNTLEGYKNFQKQISIIKYRTLEFLIKEKLQKKTIIGYGAPAKGNTFLNYCGIRTEFLDYTVDKNPHKQDLFLPGTKIPIYSPDYIKKTQPDSIFILPWNLKKEISLELSYTHAWGATLFVAIPKIEMYSYDNNTYSDIGSKNYSVSSPYR